MPAQPPSACILDQSLPTETAASFFVNPLTGNDKDFILQRAATLSEVSILGYAKGRLKKMYKLGRASVSTSNELPLPLRLGPPKQEIEGERIIFFIILFDVL